MPRMQPMIERTLAQHARPAPDGMRQDRSRDRRRSGVGVRARGDVACSLVGPNIAVTAMPTAAARCMAPESFVTSARQLREHAGERRQVGAADEIRAIERDRIVSRAFDLVRRRRHPRPLPTSTHCTPSAARPSASSANDAGGQRFAPPYAAPGASATSGCCPSHPGVDQQIQRRSRAPRGHRQPRLGRTVRETRARARGAGSTRPDERRAARGIARVSSEPRQSVR